MSWQKPQWPQRGQGNAHSAPRGLPGGWPDTGGGREWSSEESVGPWWEFSRKTTARPSSAAGAFWNVCPPERPGPDDSADKGPVAGAGACPQRPLAARFRGAFQEIRAGNVGGEPSSKGHHTGQGTPCRDAWPSTHSAQDWACGGGWWLRCFRSGWERLMGPPQAGRDSRGRRPGLDVRH